MFIAGVISVHIAALYMQNQPIPNHERLKSQVRSDSVVHAGQPGQ